MANEKIDDGGQAFPIHPMEIAEPLTGVPYRLQGQPGMSFRLWLAGKAMAGLLSSPEPLDLCATHQKCQLALGVEKFNYSTMYPRIIAKASVAYADALIAELRKGREEDQNV